MPTPDQTRLEQAQRQPRVLQLWWALQPLRSVVRLMNTGAHPDDETSALLAALAFRDGINLSYACSTRGEGGQNDIGTESGAALGALRTREMEHACDVLNMRLYWHSTAPDDTITDFRFSKSGEETLRIWGQDRLMARFVEIVRGDKPDIILPTFLDVPGQHGHHRAMTQAAHQVIKDAADPAFPSNLPPWQVSKLYLPAWSGAGQAYDDDLPPPLETLRVSAAGHDPVSGWSFARIGQLSRAFHRTQGMGRWVPAGPGQDYPLHRVDFAQGEQEDNLFDGLPRTLADLATLAPDQGEALRDVQGLINEIPTAFPDFAKTSDLAVRALATLQNLLIRLDTDAHALIGHRLTDKITQLGHVLRIALGVEARAQTHDIWLRPGENTQITVENHALEGPVAEPELELPSGWQLRDKGLHIAPNAPVTDPYRDRYDPAAPPAPRLVLQVGPTKVALPFDSPPVVLPPRVAVAQPDAALINLETAQRQVRLRVTGQYPADADLSLSLPTGWQVARTDTGFDVVLPPDIAPGLYKVPVLLDGQPALTETRIKHSHTNPTVHTAPAALTLRVMSVQLPQVRVGYVGSGHDRVAHWMTALGLDVTDLSDMDLMTETNLDAFDTIVIGIFALRFRHGLVQALPRLHDWVQKGGNLVTLYHRPWDNWDPETTPPLRLEIGQPSLRWRVTDASAVVTHLGGHTLLTSPNVIGPGDWEGWVKERGLYFAKSWDAAYTPLLSMSDPGEDPLTGALLTAKVGQGRHSHCALILHHQMAHLVPGAFRLMANLVVP